MLAPCNSQPTLVPKGAGATPSSEEDVAPQQPVDNRPRLEATEAATLARLQEVDPDTLSPREAMDLLYELRGILRGQHEWLEE